MKMKRESGAEIESAVRKIVESSSGPMFYLDPGGSFVCGNKAYEKIRATVKKQILQKQAEAEKLLRLALAGKPVSRMGKIGNANYLLTMNPILSGKKSKYFILCTLTENGGMPAAAEKAPDSQYLLRTMAHELKTPLSNIFLTLDFLISECALKHKDDAKLKQLQRLKKQAFQLMELIDNFLDMARSKEGLFEPYVENFELRELLDEINDTISPFAAGKGLEWKIISGRGLPKEIESDSEMLKRILLNFLSNACKFTEKGIVSLSVSGKPRAVVFEISDSGCGIDEKEMESIFEPFTRGSALGPRASGFGLGLSIARMFVNALNGQIEVESELGRGSKFTLILPLKTKGKPPGRR
jgi:anti-sigma regulatory factor (Ser/Thr protein kinase)